MKKIIYSFAIVLLALSIQSCKSTKKSTSTINSGDETTTLEDGPKSKIDRFVSVESVSELRAGMTLNEVIGKLGSNPYNFLSAQADGHHIVQYKYRMSSMEVNADQVDDMGIEKKNNKLYYKPNNHDLYIVFNGAGKLEYLVTDEYPTSEKLLRENNLLYVIKKDKDKYSANPDNQYRKTNADAFSPMTVCQGCNTPMNSAPAPVNTSLNKRSKSDNTMYNETEVKETSVEESQQKSTLLPIINPAQKKKRGRGWFWIGLLALGIIVLS